MITNQKRYITSLLLSYNTSLVAQQISIHLKPKYTPPMLPSRFTLTFLFLIFLTNCFTLKQDITLNDFTSQGVQFINIKAFYPDAKLASNDKLTIRGANCNLNWTEGQVMTRIGNNTWSMLIGCIIDTTLEFKLLLNDRVWMLGGNQRLLVKYEGVPQIYVHVYPSFSPLINRVYDTQAVASSILKNSRKCSIYLPPSYHDNTLKKYPILFMHDGQNLFDDSKAAFGVAWRIQDTINDLIGKGVIEEVIVVGIWNTNDRTNEYTYSYDPSYKFGGKGDLYLDFVQKELQPIVNQKWFVNRVREGGYSIGGSSLGGLISCYAMYKRSDFFTNAICMSSSFWWNSEDFNNQVLTPDYNNRTKVYLDSGDAGDSQDGKTQTLTVKAHLEQIGYKSSRETQNLFYYLDKNAQHNEYFWGRRFHVPLVALFGTD